MLFNDLHRKNANSSIKTTDEGIITLVNEMQFANAYFPIEVTLDGIVISVMFLQL